MALAALEHRPAVTARAGSELKRQVLGKLADWRITLRHQPQEARQVIRQLLADRIGFAPVEQDGARVYRYRGTFTIGGLFEGTICPLLASLAIPSWNQLHAG